MSHSRSRLAAAKSRLSILLAGTALSMLCLPATVLAQEAETPERASDHPADEILVTARRRSESLQDVPLSVSALSADVISDLQADTIEGIQYAVPNVYIEQGDGANAVIYIRGVGQNDSLAFADAGVGVYVDDVFIARSQSAFLDLFDVERVEVLRGPQGTLYGRNTIGGAVKFVSTTPPEEFEAYAELGAGNYNFRTFKGRIGGPLSPGRLRGKAAVSYTARDGYSENSFTGEDDGDIDSFSARAALLFTPSDTLDVLVTVEGKKNSPDSSKNGVRETPLTGAPDPVGDPTNLVTFPATGPYEVDANATGLSDLSASAATVKVNWQASESVSFESITSARQMDFDLNLDTDGSPLPILDILLEQEQSQVTQELRMTYDNDGPLVFTGGAYYFNDDDVTFSGVDNGSAAIFGFPVIVFGFATSAYAETSQDTESYALYGDVSYDLTDRLNIGGGLRYTKETKTSRREFENFFDPSVSLINNPPPFMGGQGVVGTPISGEADFDAVTPKVNVSFDASDNMMLYASAARGFKSGGFDGRANDDFGFQPFDPEFVWSYEAGMKSSWADGRLILNGDIFYNDYTDMQVTSFGSDPVSGVFVSQFTNAGKAKSVGAELEILARPAEGLTLNGSIGYLDAEYEEFEILVGGVATDVTDRAMVNSPKWSLHGGATYETPVTTRWIGTLHGDISYRSEYANEITASPILMQDSYTLLNAFASLRTEDERWELRAGIKNITDEEIKVQGFNLSEFPGVELAYYGAPQTYDFRVIFRY